MMNKYRLSNLYLAILEGGSISIGLSIVCNNCCFAHLSNSIGPNLPVCSDPLVENKSIINWLPFFSFESKQIKA